MHVRTQEKCFARTVFYLSHPLPPEQDHFRLFPTLRPEGLDLSRRLPGGIVTGGIEPYTPFHAKDIFSHISNLITIQVDYFLTGYEKDLNRCLNRFIVNWVNKVKDIHNSAQCDSSYNVIASAIYLHNGNSIPKFCFNIYLHHGSSITVLYPILGIWLNRGDSLCNF